MFAVCDGSFINEYNIPVMVVGPGQSKYAHTVEEHLAIEELVNGAKIYALLIAEWCGIQKNLVLSKIYILHNTSVLGYSIKYFY
ncbi:hypothetical protein AZF37_01285 [endosymbiont 'TC1' of Trimyema compressum]|uniref:M20/M25/M40 family metallo-hydrolase n=1 Tax=endosymbiont 'TC1' of Trimyema compressum TaxID=243899 RepID=UPI0007F10584|nr:M20/M25/M40 family metallo-hydrolase [endosymbiont 'TC1' of Trimyema compressum]AMP19993.1 hypothetical protein AZF37_01285 [endosymbiont 'TC1' of Trimyema compressum]